MPVLKMPMPLTPFFPHQAGRLWDRVSGEGECTHWEIGRLGNLLKADVSLFFRNSLKLDAFGIERFERDFPIQCRLVKKG